ncbi:selenide, water dikinase [Spiroplasma chinense]|uniref:Selenide, water dikinase n=1 Tax=Spiroplasma chinense TaxID=216932 RepID=A0A5B9Y2W4_9MOLU|nr:selenide, water dikinase SelD [Spiroplasma chinense]QEH61408.1 selenide, water dikinase [Spiroplasma chinense]
MNNINCMGGCSAKLDNKRLQKILKLSNSSLKNNEDCSIYDLGNGTSLVESIDYFPQISDSYYIYGQITACNSISDIYAMGATPKFALSVLTVTNEMSDEEIAEIIKGMISILNPLDIRIEGGHTIITNDLICGLSVTGFVNNKDLKQNNTPNIGDVIVLSKPLGFGTIIAAKTVDMVDTKDYKEALKWMTTPNKEASLIAVKYNFSALTDVTGFGLAGHLLEMMGSSYCAQIAIENLPIVGNALQYLDQYFLNGAIANNRRNYKDEISFSFKPSFGQKEIFFDPQTSGGLLGTVDSETWANMDEESKKCFWQIGVVGNKREKAIEVND